MCGRMTRYETDTQCIALGLRRCACHRRMGVAASAVGAVRPGVGQHLGGRFERDHRAAHWSAAGSPLPALRRRPNAPQQPCWSPQTGTPAGQQRNSTSSLHSPMTARPSGIVDDLRSPSTSPFLSYANRIGTKPGPGRRWKPHTAFHPRIFPVAPTSLAHEGNSGPRPG